MADYSGAIFALVAITSVLTAAVVFVLAQPTDLPVIKKIQGWTASIYPKNSGKTMATQDLLVLAISFGTACFALNIYKMNRAAQH